MVGNGGITAINAYSTDEVEVYSDYSGIVINSNIPIDISIYNITGQYVYSATILGKQKINLKKGIYIVRAANFSKKIIIE